MLCCLFAPLVCLIGCNNAPPSSGATASDAGQSASATGSSASGVAAGSTQTGGGAASGNAPVADTNTAPAAPAIAPIAWPYIGFVNNPGGNDAKAVALSFDDGPDGAGSDEGKAGKTNMSTMLDQLDALGLKATFFLCGNMWTNVLTDKLAQADVQRMVQSGHHFGSHTYNHNTLNSNYLSPAQVQNEMVMNQQLYTQSGLLGGNNTFTMWRAPYGTPFQDGIAFPPTASTILGDMANIAPYTYPNAVHVGWGIDSKDWLCVQNGSTDPNCVLSNVNAFLDKGASGVILMHTVYKLSTQALPMVVQAIYDHNYHIVMVEDFIKAKYGASSSDIQCANANATFDGNQLLDAALAAAKTSKWYLGTNED